jgi:hypothetical protein
MKKIAILLLLITGIRFLSSCCDKEGYKYRWTDVNLLNIDITNDRNTPLTGNVATAAQFGFRIILDHESVAINETPAFGFNTAQATSCAGYFPNTDKIETIEVISRFPFNSSHGAGSFVTSFVEAKLRPYAPNITSEYKPIPSLLGFLNENKDNGVDDYEYDCRFKNANMFSGQHRFIIQLRFASGRVVSDSTSITIL